MIADGRLPLPGELESLVDDGAYAELLGYPGQGLPEGRIHGLATGSRQWFRDRARAWGATTTVAVKRIEQERIELADGTVLTSPAFAARLLQGGSTSIIVAVVSAGAEIDQRSAELWANDRPDEAYFLDRLGAAIARRLGRWAGEHLRRQAARHDLDLLPGYSPGFDGWSLLDQRPLAGCLTTARAADGNRGDGSVGAASGGPELLPAGFRVLQSGMIEPRNSLLAAFGVTRFRAVAAAAWRRHPCSWCSLAECRVRGGALPVTAVES